MPLILGTDKKRLSKRHGATSVTEYQRLGYLPEAMVNFLALLGWSPGTDQEVFTRDELVRLFALEGISGGNAVFNPEKLDWMNQQHIGRLQSDDILGRIEPELKTAGLWRDSFTGAERAWLLKVIDLLKPRVRTLAQVVEDARPFLVDEVTPDAEAVKKHLGQASLRGPFHTLIEAFERLDHFPAECSRSDASRNGGAVRYQGRSVDSRDSCRGDRTCRQSGTVRSAGTAGPGSDDRKNEGG